MLILRAVSCHLSSSEGVSRRRPEYDEEFFAELILSEILRFAQNDRKVRLLSTLALFMFTKLIFRGKIDTILGG